MKTQQLFIMVFFCLALPLLADYSDTLDCSSYLNGLSFNADSIFDHPVYDGYISYVSDSGKPTLPYEIYKILIPKDEKADSISISYIDTATIEGFIIYPGQGPVSFSDTLHDFVPPDSVIYTSSTPYPEECLSLDTTVFFDGMNKIIELRFFPLQYVGSDTLLTVNENIVYTLHTSASSDTGTTPSIRTKMTNVESTYDLKRLVSNPDDVDDLITEPSVSTSEGCFDYLIITPDSLTSFWCRFAEWKKDVGYRVEIRTTEWILANYSGGEDYEKVQDYIEIARADSCVKYVLLGGQYEDVPGQEDYAEPLDNCYLRLGYINRVPVANRNDIRAWTQKLIRYERRVGIGT